MGQEDALQSVRVRPGWTLPVLVVGLVLLAVGGWAVHHTWTAADLCAALPGMQGCSTTLFTQDAGAIALVAGVGLVLVGGGFGLRRSRAAVGGGTPWVIHRQLTGRWSGLTVGRAAIAGLAVTLVAALCGHDAWSSYARQQRAAAYQRAQQSLPELRLPAALQAVTSGAAGCQASSVRRCATSSATPVQLQPALRQLVGGHEVDVALNAAIGCPGGQCPVEVQGMLRGYPVLIIAFHQLLDSRTQAVPSGAVPVTAGKSVYFWAGSDVVIELVDPSSPA